MTFRPFAALAVALGAALAPASAQTTPAERPAVTVPLPSGSGVFYYRAGTPGGVRIRSGRARVDSVTAASAEAASPVGAAPAALGREVRREPSREGISRLDLLLLERNLLDALDRRLDRRESSRSSAAPLLQLPAPQAQRPLAPPVAPPPVAGPVAPRPPAPAAPPVGVPTAQEIERSILDTGLFRTTTVQFEFAKSALLPVSAQTLDVVAGVLARYPALRIEVGGHTDNVGSDAVNDPLSQRRAQSVVDYLTGSGIDRDRLSAAGYGERRPVADNDTETGRALNRRVEFTVLNPEAATQETVRDVTPDSDALRQMIRDEVERARDGQ